MIEIELLEQNAIDAAVHSDWEIAICLNKKILQIDKKNLSAVLRLGFASLQTSKLLEAKKYYQKALKLQAGNTVAKENLERIKILQIKGSSKGKKTAVYLDPNLFLEVSGKTKSIGLVNVGQKNVLAQLTTGQEVFLKPKKRKVEVRDKNNDYIGSLPDDISKRLMLFLNAGSTYNVFIKEGSLNKVVVFVREEKKGKKVSHYLSFPQNSQSNIAAIASDKETDEEGEDLAENELDRLAQALTNEEKEYLPYQHGQDENDDEES